MIEAVLLGYMAFASIMFIGWVMVGCLDIGCLAQHSRWLKKRGPVRLGRWRTRCGVIAHVTKHEPWESYYPWSGYFDADGAELATCWPTDGLRRSLGDPTDDPRDLVEYLGPNEGDKQ